MKRKIITDIKVLKEISKIADDPNEVYIIIKELEDSLKDQKGIGLTAIQIGISLRIAIIRIPNKEPINLVNPVIIEKEEKFRMVGERCLSLPGLSIDTKRYKQIMIENNGERYVLYGLEAVVCQHEIEHMNGKTILDSKWRKRR